MRTSLRRLGLTYKPILITIIINMKRGFFKQYILLTKVLPFFVSNDLFPITWHLFLICDTNLRQNLDDKTC